MKHIRMLTRHRTPAKAQFEPALQLVGLIQAILGLTTPLIYKLDALVGLIESVQDMED